MALNGILLPEHPAVRPPIIPRPRSSEAPELGRPPPRRRRSSAARRSSGRPGHPPPARPCGRRPCSPGRPAARRRRSGACAREERGARERGGKRGGRESSEAVPDLRFVSGKIRNLVISIVVARELVNRYMNRILDLKIYLLNTSDLDIIF